MWPQGTLVSAGVEGHRVCFPPQQIQELAGPKWVFRPVKQISQTFSRQIYIEHLLYADAADTEGDDTDTTPGLPTIQRPGEDGSPASKCQAANAADIWAMWDALAGCDREALILRFVRTKPDTILLCSCWETLKWHYQCLDFRPGLGVLKPKFFR